MVYVLTEVLGTKSDFLYKENNITRTVTFTTDRWRFKSLNAQFCFVCTVIQERLY